MSNSVLAAMSSGNFFRHLKGENQTGVGLELFIEHAVFE